MTIKVGINGFGRMGRLTLRAAWDNPELSIVHVNDPAGEAFTFAHLLEFDSVHGRWPKQIVTDKNSIFIDEQKVSFTQNTEISETDWSNCDIVIEASGKFKTKAALQDYLDIGVKRIVVTAPVKDEGILNIVRGVNEHLFDPGKHPIVTAASCTTNCLAPVVKVIHETLGIEHGP
nr:glyceraldehyde 3-phosphate dehydrogenase NAD-binding domain-containing protein [Sneathiella glossodoripedis]